MVETAAAAAAAAVTKVTFLHSIFVFLAGTTLARQISVVLVRNWVFNEMRNYRRTSMVHLGRA